MKQLTILEIKVTITLSLRLELEICKKCAAR